MVVLGRGLGKGTVTLDVFGSQETERKNQKRRMRFKKKIFFFSFLQLGIIIFFFLNFDVKK